MPRLSPRGTAADEAELAAFIKSRNIEHGHAQYWLAHRLTFLWQEHPAIAAFEWDRYPPYRLEAERARRKAFIFHPSEPRASPQVYWNALQQAPGRKEIVQVAGFTVILYEEQPEPRMAEAPQADRWATALFPAIAAFAVGQAVQVANGNVHPESIKWLTIACLATFVGVVLPTLGIINGPASRWWCSCSGLGVAYQFNQLLSAPPGIYLRANLVVPSDFHVGLGIAALLVGAGLAKKPWLGRFHLWALLAAFLFLGHWLLKASPAPFIDVFVFQRDGVHALLAGNNPYALRYPDIYGNSPFYGEGLSVNGVLQFGYPYFPLSLLLALPGQVLLGDYRYAQLAAMALSAVFIAKARPGRVGIAAASLLLFTPRVFFVLEQGWTDPFVLLGLSAVVFVAIRWKPALPWVLGLTLAVKQYTVFMVPAAWQLLPRRSTPASWRRWSASPRW
ncbi:MAG: hypothetical protein IPJ65_05435 [Archangiaceae bacterium]|nr:hypothetical protein [Archangiaceae bacterium]